MGANDSPITTRAVVTDYFDWRLNNKTTNNRLFLIVHQVAKDCETAYLAQDPTLNFLFSSPNNLHTLENIRDFHHEIAKETFSDGRITWGRIMTYLGFSALFAEYILQQQTTQMNPLSRTLIISSIIDWTTNFIDTDLHEWLQDQDYWVGCLRHYSHAPQRRNSIGRYAGILGTIGLFTLGALYLRRT